MLRTWLTERWGLRHPILNAPMTPAAGAALARAVSDAGGLGVVGLDWREARDSIARELGALRDARVPFGVGAVTWALEQSPDLLELALSFGPRFVALSFGPVAPWVPRLRAAGVAVVAQVQDRAGAVEAARAGVDVVVAQGTEAGGHTGKIGTMTMLQVVLDAVDVPVLAAGGIGSPRGLAAAIAAGAEGAWLGTTFLFAEEARVTEATRARLSESSEGDTVLTSVFDRVQGIPWPPGIPGRAIRNDFTARFDGHEDAIDDAARQVFQAGKARGDLRIANVYAGEAVGLRHGTTTARAIVEELAAGTERLLRERCASVLA
jgi:nitronate monooxygenase